MIESEPLDSTRALKIKCKRYYGSYIFFLKWVYKEIKHQQQFQMVIALL